MPAGVGLRSLTMLVALGGCTVGPDFVQPDSPAMPAWRNAQPTDAAVSQTADPDPQWWTLFHDPVLTDLVHTAIRGNLDLQQAVLRVIEARQSIVVARAAGLPTLNGTAIYSREQFGAKGILESSGVYRQLNALADQNLPSYLPAGLGRQADSAATGLANDITQPLNLYQYGLDASWELDLFGRVRRSVEQAKATTQAQQEATNDALLMLESEVAQTYLQLRVSQALAAIEQENVGTAERSLELTEKLQRTGFDTATDVDQARTQVLTYQSQLPGYEKQAQQAIDSLNVLVGQPPGFLDARLSTPAPLPTLPDVIGVGVPSTLARRRPDIREAEAQLHASTANVGVAVAAFYPDVSLTGNLGIRAIDASYLTNWASHFYSAGPSLSLPIFQGGRLTANLRLARAQAIAAALSYRGTVLNALREVEDELVAYRTDRDERDRLVGVLRSGEDTFYLATNAFSHGLDSFLQVLDAQRTVTSARQQLVQTDSTLTNDVVALYRALGGGWQSPGAQSQTPAVPQPPPPLPAALDSLAARSGPAQSGGRSPPSRSAGQYVSR